MANNQNNLPPSSAITNDDHEFGNQTRLSKTKSNKVLEYMRSKRDWIEQMRGYLMVVATVITTITYQPALSPPGGVWQTDIKDANQSIACSDEAKCEAGTLVFAYGNLEFVFLCYLICNSIAFTASLCVIFLLISGFPLTNKCFMVILTLAMCTTLTFLGITYVLAFVLLIPSNLREQLGYMMFIPIGVLLCLILVVLLIHLIRFLFKICKFIFTSAKKQIC
ncbi:hypothetical protein ACB092_05G033400 [Castanea dentata]